MKAQVKNKVKKIKVLILDVDGVLTDGRIIMDCHGKEIKNFNVHDGVGIMMMKRAGFKTAIISAKSAEAVTARAKDLKIDRVYQDAYPKEAAFKKVLREFKVNASEACFMADDIPDIGVFKKVGFAVAVCNGVDELKKHADYITKKPGGFGAVREVTEIILKTQGKWAKGLKHYDP